MKFVCFSRVNVFLRKTERNENNDKALTLEEREEHGRTASKSRLRYLLSVHTQLFRLCYDHIQVKVLREGDRN